jgi:hypothetical protein
MAGTGKSTIAFTIARACNDEKRLGASFFFSRGDGNLGNAAKFFTTLATQLANTLPDLKPHIGAAITNNPDISQRGLAEQWKHLIFQPLCKLHQASHQSQPFILVIDALDECGNEDDVQLIVRLLAESNTLTTARLRVFLTSRRETCIRLGFHTISDAAHHDVILHEIPLPIIHNDVSLFLHHEFEIIRCQPENNLPPEWPGDAAINDLCERAKGLFIYASTACRFIRDVGPEDGLHMVLQDTYLGLDQLYVEILRRSIVYTDHIQPYQTKISRGLRQIIGSIVILFDPLPLAMLARLLAISVTSVQSRLRSLHAVLEVPEDQVPIRLLHPSFRDFLLDQNRCTDPQFWIDEKKAHNDTLMNCLNLMSKHLKQDMCDLKLPGARPSNTVVENCIPLDVQYATRYWVHHLQYGDVELCDYEKVHTFLRTHFLHWFETLGLIGKISDGVLMVRNLEATLTVSNFSAPRSSITN